MTFILVFVAKFLETILTTLRIILISHHKKISGAFLNLFISIIWIYSTITVVHNLNSEPYKIIGFCLGCFIGSFFGSLIEEKIHNNSSLIICITNKKELVDTLYDNNIDFLNVINNNKFILFITQKNKEKKLIKSLIKKFDKSATVLNGKF